MPPYNKRDERNLNTGARPANINNTCNDTFDANNSALSSIKLLSGTITKLNPGSYDAIVDTNSKTDLMCIVASNIIPAMPWGLGVSESKGLAEGSRVLVAQISQNTGVIICPMPAPLPSMEYITSGKVPHSQLDHESGISVKSEPAYSDPSAMIADNCRAIDILPGDIAWFNEFLVGMAVRKLVTYIQASERAKLELFLMDDEVRLTSGHFQHNSAIGEQNIFNSNGFNTMELIGSHHQCEMSGNYGYGNSFINAESSELSQTKGALKYEDDRVPYIRNRYTMHLGAVGSIFSFFVSKPADPIKDLGVNQPLLSEPTQDSGLFHTSVNSNGRLLVRSAGGICLQRTDIIPSPKKTSHEWFSGAGSMAKQTSFEWDKVHPYARSLQLRDAFAWYTRNAYDGYIAAGNYHIPEHADLETPSDIYDTVHDEEGKWTEYGKAEFNDSKHKGASSYLHMGEDGSIIIRGKCGEEITMQGGNIIISCPGNIELKPGKSTVVMSGRDTVIKSKKSTDITSTDKDVRIKAQKNLHLYSAEGGILIENDGTGDIQNFEYEEDYPGEDVVSSGIILKATKSRVFTWADKVHTSFKSSNIIEALGQAGAQLKIIVPRLLAFVKGGGIALKTENAALQLGSNQATLVGNTAYMSGTSSAAVFKGSKFMVPMSEAPVGMNPHEMMITALEPLDEQAHDDSNLGESYTVEKREEIKFGFRSSEQYGTDKPSEVFEPPEKFEMYEPSWVHLKEVAKDPELIAGETDVWKEKEVNETYPYPGKECYEEDCLIKLKEEVNIDKANQYKLWVPPLKEPDKGMKNNGTELEVKSLNELTVIK